MLPALLLASVTIAAPASEVSVPAGFSISLFADNPLAPDIYTMTIDDAGRVLVAGRGYVRVLVDDDGDGIADRSIDLIDGLKDGPMGLLAEGETLYVISEGGLQRYRGYNGMDKLKGPPETLVKLKTSGEHDAHMIRRGPDGWLYLLCGNSAGVNKRTIVGRRSPVKNPVAGAMLRISPDGKDVEVVADGFRNPYSFDFNLEGEPFASDSDNERCVGLPWYEQCRFYHIIPAGNYGWRSPQLGKFWRKPPYFIDCVAPVCYLGRGSPTGVACYRHTHFPEYYRGGFFLADWTFGRIDFVPLEEDGSTYTGEAEVFAEAVGTSGFAPTGLAVHPQTGELFVSIGGRGTRGGVYRIKHNTNPCGKPLPMTPRSLGWSVEAGKQWFADARWNGQAKDIGTPAEQRARRRALELILRHADLVPWDTSLTEAVKPNLSFPERSIRMAAARGVRGALIKVGQVDDPQARLMLALMDVNDDPDWALRVAMDIIENKKASPELKLEAVRVVQLCYGDLTAPGTAGTIWEGYTLRTPLKKKPPIQLIRVLESLFFTKNSNLTREVERTLFALGDDRVRLAFQASRLDDNSSVESDVHYLAILTRSGGELMNWQTRRIVECLLNLEDKVAREWVTRDQNWPLRLEEILEALGQSHPEIAEILLKDYRFGRPEHLLFVKALGITSTEAAKKFLNAAENDPNYAWTPGIVRLLQSLSLSHTRPVLRKLWDRPNLRDAIVLALSEGPEQDDRAKFVYGLGSLDPAVVHLSALALAKLNATSEPTELAAAIKALRKLAPEDKATREAIASLLKKMSGETFPADPKPWTEWAMRKYPEVLKLLNSNDGFDPAAWKKREENIPWNNGDPTRGRATFIKASCAACHDGGRAMGPSLQGVAKRFSRDDLLTAVLQPSKDVSPRYRPTRVTTADDKVIIGMVIYDATDGLILQTNADTVIRIAGENIASKRVVDVSLMPAGLLDKLTDAEVADLFAYLRAPEEVKGK